MKKQSKPIILEPVPVVPQPPDPIQKNLDIAEGKAAQVADDGTVSITQGQNIVFLRSIEVEKLKRWLNEII